MNPNNSLPEHWILLRGLIRSRHHWLNFAKQLQASLNLKSVEMLELPGNGYLYEEVTPTLIENAISALRKQSNLPTDQSFGLIGISLGGMLASRWAQIYPQEISKLVLINSSSSLSPFYKRLKPQHYFTILTHLLRNNPQKSEEMIMSITSNREDLWKPLIPNYTEFQKQHPIRIANFLRQLELSTQVNFADVPSMSKLILTSQADRLVSSACSTAIAQAWNCDIKIHTSAGHDLPLDDAAWVISQIGSMS